MSGWRERWRRIEEHAAARERISALLEDRTEEVAPPQAPTRGPLRPVVCDALVTHDELNARHGTGLLLQLIFGRGRDLLTVRSGSFYGGAQATAFRSVFLPLGDIPRPEVYARALQATRGLRVRRILCVPYRPDDARTAVALRDLFDAPLGTWVMDDQNVADHRIDDASMRELLEKSRVRLAIGPELKAAYEEKYGLPFHVAPPLVRPEEVRAGPPDPGDGAGRPLLTGNVYGQRWLDGLRRAVREAGLAIDWTSPSAYRFERFELEALEADGIHPLGRLEGDAFRARLRAAPFVVVPTGTLAAGDDRDAVARFSVPSRMTFALAASHTPMIVVGSPDTAAGRFVERLGVGRVVPYDAAALRAAAAELSAPAAQAALRARAAALAPHLSAGGMAEWLWASMERGAPADDRFAPLEAPAAEGARR